MFLVLFFLVFIWSALVLDVIPMFILRKICFNKNLSNSRQWLCSIATAFISFTFSVIVWMFVIDPYGTETSIWGQMYMFIGNLCVDWWIIFGWLFHLLSAFSFIWIKKFAFKVKVNSKTPTPIITKDEQALLDLFRAVPEDKREWLMQTIRFTLGN